jgi:hypothetical protein
MPPLSRAALAFLLVGLAAPAQARVTDPAAVNTLDLRFETGLATPIGFLGGSLSVPWRYFALEASGGFGLTGVQLSVMPKIIPLRWDRNQLMAGVGATVALPVTGIPMARERTYWLTAEVAYQRTMFIDNILYIGAGVTRGSYYNQCLNLMNTMCGVENKVLWPELRLGFGRRY